MCIYIYTYIYMYIYIYIYIFIIHIYMYTTPAYIHFFMVMTSELVIELGFRPISPYIYIYLKPSQDVSHHFEPSRAVLRSRKTVLQCVAVCCSVLQCVAVSRAVLRSLKTVLQCVAVCCSVLQCLEPSYSFSTRLKPS